MIRVSATVGQASACQRPLAGASLHRFQLSGLRRVRRRARAQRPARSPARRVQLQVRSGFPVLPPVPQLPVWYLQLRGRARGLVPLPATAPSRSRLGWEYRYLRFQARVRPSEPNPVRHYPRLLTPISSGAGSASGNSSLTVAARMGVSVPSLSSEGSPIGTKSGAALPSPSDTDQLGGWFRFRQQLPHGRGSDGSIGTFAFKRGFAHRNQIRCGTTLSF